MSLYHWLLFLHLLAAFSLVAGIVAYGVIVLGRDGAAARQALAVPALALWNAGGIGVLVPGVALAIQAGGYSLLDGWIIVAIVLWLVASAAGEPLSRDVRDESAPLPAARARFLLLVMAAATVALLIDMVFKPARF